MNCYCVQYLRSVLFINFFWKDKYSPVTILGFKCPSVKFTNLVNDPSENKTKE